MCKITAFCFYYCRVVDNERMIIISYYYFICLLIVNEGDVQDGPSSIPVIVGTIVGAGLVLVVAVLVVVLVIR